MTTVAGFALFLPFITIVGSPQVYYRHIVTSNTVKPTIQLWLHTFLWEHRQMQAQTLCSLQYVTTYYEMLCA